MNDSKLVSAINTQIANVIAKINTDTDYQNLKNQVDATLKQSSDDFRGASSIQASMNIKFKQLFKLIPSNELKELLDTASTRIGELNKLQDEYTIQNKPKRTIFGFTRQPKITKTLTVDEQALLDLKPTVERYLSFYDSKGGRKSRRKSSRRKSRRLCHN